MTELVILVIVVFAGALVQGTLGYGVGLISVPFFLLLEPSFVPAVPMLLALPTMTLALIRDRHFVELRSFGLLTLGRLPGTFSGAVLLFTLSDFGARLLAGGVFVFVAVLTVFGVRGVLNGGAGKVAAGGLSGFMGTTTGVGGPILALAFRGADPRWMRGTLNATTLVGVLISLTAVLFAGRLGSAELVGAATLLIPAVLGVLASTAVGRHVQKKHLAVIVDVSILLSCAAVVGQLIFELIQQAG